MVSRPTAEMYQKIIHKNLCLLKEKGHKISFEEGMFLHRNQPGFEKVGYGLLMIIDPIECKKTIPWPLLNDKIAKNEFRLNFVKFIKTINKKYPSAKIPEMTASSLQHPGGENFLQFMCKLSSLAVKLELERIIGAEKLNKMCPQPKYSCSMTSKDTSAKLQIMDGFQQVTDQSNQKLMSFETASISKLQHLKTIKKHSDTQVMTVQRKLENGIQSLYRVESVKKRLKNIEDEDALSEWNTETEKKIKTLEASSDSLCRVRDLSAKSCQLTTAMEKTRMDTFCMDGFQLHLPPSIDKLVSTHATNTRGQVRLDVLLKAGAAAALQLVPSAQQSPDSPIVPLARNLLTEFHQQSTTATEMAQILHKHCAESKEAIEKLTPIISAKMEAKEFPNHLNYLDERPPLQFICGDSSSRTSSPLLKKKRMSLNSMASLQSVKGRKVVCSIRKRRSVSKYSFEQTPRQLSPPTVYQRTRTSYVPRFGFRVPSTGLSQKARVMTLTRPKTRQSMSAFKMATIEKHNTNTSPVMNLESPRKKDGIPKAIPACKRSIYGKLPSGSRNQASEDFAQLSMDDSLLHLASGNSFSEPSLVNEAQESSEQMSSTSNMEESVADVPPKKPRKSILDLVERYNKLKSSMKSSTQSNKT